MLDNNNAVVITTFALYFVLMLVIGARNVVPLSAKAISVHCRSSKFFVSFLNVSSES